MKKLLTVIVFFFTIYNLHADDFYLHQKLVDIPIDFTSEYEIRTAYPDQVPKNEIKWTKNFRYKLTKQGISYRITIHTLDTLQTELFVICFDGANFYHLTTSSKTLRVGSNVAVMSRYATGALMNFPPFIIPWTISDCGAPQEGSTESKLVFITPEKHFQLLFSVDPAYFSLSSNQVELKIPKSIKSMTLYLDNFEKIDQKSSFIVETKTAALISTQKKFPSSFFKIPAADANTITDADMDGLQFQK